MQQRTMNNETPPGRNLLPVLRMSALLMGPGVCQRPPWRQSAVNVLKAALYGPLGTGELNTAMG